MNLPAKHDAQHLPPVLAQAQGPHTFQPLPPLAPTINITPEQKLELLELWRSVLKRRWMIVGLALAAALVGGVIAFALTPVYRSTATVLIEASKGKILSIDDLYSSNNQREYFQTQVEILKSREVAERTVRALKLWDNPSFDPRAADDSWRQQLKAMLGLGNIKDVWEEADLVSGAIKALQERVSVEPVRLSQLIKVTVEAESPVLAATIANRLSQEYIDSDRDAKFKLSQDVSGFLQDRLSSLRDKLTESEKSLQDYRETKGIVSLGGSAQTIAGQQVGGTADQLIAARTRRIQLESSYQQVKGVKPGQGADVPAVMREPAVLDAQRNLADAKRRLATEVNNSGSANPRVKQLQLEIDELTGSLERARAQAVGSILRDYEQARATEQSIERALADARATVQNVNREEFQLTVLEREVSTNRELYNMFMSRAKETNLAGDVQAAVGRIVDAAVAPSLPSKPAKAQIILLSGILALFLGALASMVLDRLDNTIKGGEDAEVRLKQPVLAAVPQVELLDRKHMARLYLDDAHSHYAEAIRTARTGVLLSSLDLAHKVLLLTSSLPGEGKTTLAINLALAHAQTKRTLLIDCDMRRSQVSNGLGVPPGTKGMSNLVSGSHTLEQCIYKIDDSPLHVLTVGDMPPNPLELLLSQRFKDTLAALSAEYEMVIIDSPPVELVSDALVLAPLATSVSFVVKAMSTPAPLVRKSLFRLQRAGANLLGVLINQLDFERARLYYGEYTASSYNYGGYGGYGGKLTYDDKPGPGGKPAKT